MAVKTDPEQKQEQRLERALRKYKGKPGVLIAALQEAQEIFGYLPRKVLIRVANKLTIPLSEVYSVVSFYSFFSTVPTARHRLEVCLGTACYVQGAETLLRDLQDLCGTGPGKSAAESPFSITTTRCVGACGAAPIVKIGEELHGEMTAEKLPRLLEELEKQ
ncbi:MAG: NAD(P)H-dependent oxidoreductase subunit E [Firmicutes bacterium]|nr:NAD(P)H-dependent oxidoreductase subunit E [Bacillota bacterium]